MTFLPSPCELRGLRDLPGCTTLVSLPPEIDLSNAVPLFDRVMSAVEARDDRLRLLVLDLTDTHFMDSQGARLVEDVRRRLRPGVRCVVAADPEGVCSRVMELTGLRRDVPVYDGLAEALAS